MCLLHTHKADTKLSDEWIKDFYGYNADGVGVMYSENDEHGVPRLVVKKFLPKTAADAVKIYHEEIKGRNCAVHWRMATHGDVDFINCHPYEVIGLDQPDPIYMMHNGVLSNGNWKDKSKSDTWHYVHDFLQPLLDPRLNGDPNLAFKSAFVEILGEAIGGSNKFIMMDRFGNMSIVNEMDGVDWNGMWMSNTYAWSVPRRLRSRNNNKYYAAATSKVDEKFDPALDYLDTPEDDSWMEYVGAKYKGAAYDSTKTATSMGDTWDNKFKGAGTTGVGKSASVTPIGGSKKSKKKNKNKNALVPAVNGNPVVLTPQEKMSLREEKEVDEMFCLLDEENKPKAYTSLSYQNFYKFIDRLDIDQAWEAVYMLVDGVIDETSFIDYILDPSKWTDSKPRVAAKTNVAGGEVDPTEVHDEACACDGCMDHIVDPDDDEIFGDEAAHLSDEQRDHINGLLQRAFPEDHPSDDEIIEATLPRGVGPDRLSSVPVVSTSITPTQGIIPIGHGEYLQPATATSPIIDARQISNIFDAQSGQRVG